MYTGLFNFKNKYLYTNSLIDNEQPNVKSARFDWTAYRTLSEIYNWLDEQLMAYPNVLTNLSVGKSYENRTIRAIRLSHKEVGDNLTSVTFR